MSFFTQFHKEIMYFLGSECLFYSLNLLGILIVFTRYELDGECVVLILLKQYSIFRCQIDA